MPLTATILAFCVWSSDPLHDCAIFPSAAELERRIEINREYRADLVELLKVWPNYPRAQEALTEALVLSWSLRALHDGVDVTGGEWYYPDEVARRQERRQELRRYRSIVGDRLYYSGWSPPAVPTWRLPVLRTRDVAARELQGGK